MQQEREGGAYEGQEQLRVFQLFKRKYVYSPSQDTFRPLDAMPAHLPRQICSAFDDLRFIHTAGDASVPVALDPLVNPKGEYLKFLQGQT